MPLKYNKVLTVSAKSGIGLAYAKTVVADGKRAIIVGQRKENLDLFVRQHGQGKAYAVVFEIIKLEQIPGFVEQVTRNYPDFDSDIINSGIQLGFDFAKPETADLATVDLEFTTNYIAYVHLTKTLIPFLQKQDKEIALIYTSSALALVPAVRQLNYSATIT